MSREWEDRLEKLIAGGADLEGGAELVVDDPDGTEVFRAALARMWRHELDNPQLVWIRPIFGAYQDYDGAPCWFSLSAARRRALEFTHVSLDYDDGGQLVFELVNGQRARIRPIRADLQPELERWDTFFLTQISAQVEADLEALAEDSWHGEWE